MDSNWLEWRHYEKFWDEFEEKGWELGPVRYLNLPPILAEFGPYRILFRYRDPDTDESLFEVRQMHDGEEYKAVLVWGVPTPREAKSLLERYGIDADDFSEEMPSESVHEATAQAEGFWGELLPQMVHADDFHHTVRR